MDEKIIVGKQTLKTVYDDYLVCRVDANGRLEVITFPGPSNQILKGRIFNLPVVAATNFFAADLAPTNTPTTFRIYVALDTAGVLSVQRTSVGVPVAENLNSGTALVADASYMFNILVHEDDTINLRTTVGAQILYCMVTEVPGAMA